MKTSALSDDPSLYVAGKGVQRAIEGGELSLSKPGMPSGAWGWLDHLGGAAANIAGRAADLYLGRAVSPAPERGAQYATDQSYFGAGASALQTGEVGGVDFRDPAVMLAIGAGVIGLALILKK